MSERASRNNADAAPSLVSVIIPVYNDGEQLRRCLTLLGQQTYPDDAYEVIVVDNGSEESIEPLLEPFPHACGGFDDRPGPYAARNTGIEMSQGEIVAFTDADCLPDERWLEAGVRALEEKENTGLVAGAIDFVFETAGRPNAVELYDSVKHLQQKKYAEEHKYGATANVFTYRDVIDDVGDFAASVHVFSAGDAEWGRRVHAAGYDVRYAPDVRVGHPARSTWGELIKKERRAARENWKEPEEFASATRHVLHLLKRTLRASVPPRFSRVWGQAERAYPEGKVAAKISFYFVNWAVRSVRRAEVLRSAWKGYIKEMPVLKHL